MYLMYLPWTTPVKTSSWWQTSRHSTKSNWNPLPRLDMWYVCCNWMLIYFPKIMMIKHPTLIECPRHRTALIPNWHGYQYNCFLSHFTDYTHWWLGVVLRHAQRYWSGDTYCSLQKPIGTLLLLICSSVVFIKRPFLAVTRPLKITQFSWASLK